MAIRDDKPMCLLSAGSSESRRNTECNGAAQVSAENYATAVPIERRGEARRDCQQTCSYEMLEAVEEEAVVIRQGEAFSLNQSAKGMLLLMSQAPHEKQLIEVHSPQSGWGRVVNVFETRWARPVPVESLGSMYLSSMYLIGCQRIFGPVSTSVVQQASD